jgi:hypothetical protein
MATGKNSKIQIETGQTLNAFAAMTDSGDQQIYTKTAGLIWSGKSGFTPDVRPNGITSGRNLLSAGATNDTVRVAGFSAYSKSVEQSPSATSITVTRATSGGGYKIISVTMASDGSIAKVAGSENVGAFSETRDAAGGPPLIPVESVELGQVRITSSTAAAVTSDEIFQEGQYTEHYDSPVWDENNIGDGIGAAAAAQKNAYIKFQSALPQIHTGAVPKAVYLKYYAPQFTEVSRVLDFVPAESSHTVSSQEYYRGAIASVAESVGQGSFTALLNDGLTDSLILQKNAVITVKQFPDENKNPFSLTQGKLGLGRTFPVANQNQAEVTISAEKPTAEFSS